MLDRWCQIKPNQTLRFDFLNLSSGLQSPYDTTMPKQHRLFRI